MRLRSLDKKGGFQKNGENEMNAPCNVIETSDCSLRKLLRKRKTILASNLTQKKTILVSRRQSLVLSSSPRRHGKPKRKHGENQYCKEEWMYLLAAARSEKGKHKNFLLQTAALGAK